MWKRSNVWSLAVLIGRGLNPYNLVSTPQKRITVSTKTILDPFTCFGANHLIPQYTTPKPAAFGRDRPSAVYTEPVNHHDAGWSSGSSLGS